MRKGPVSAYDNTGPMLSGVRSRKTTRKHLLFKATTTKRVS
jgi:hypothetical protein